MDIQLKINHNCINCDCCKLICPENAVIYHQSTYFIEPWACTLCNICVEVCPTEAIKIKTSTTTSTSSS